MTTDGPLMEGWTRFGGQSRKFHYIPADAQRALCGKWGLSPFAAAARERADLQPENGPSPDDCAECRRRLDKALAASAEGRKEQSA